MLTKESREDLRWAMKATLLEQAKKIQVKEARHFVKNFILKEATYEQLLNLSLNPYRDERYLEAEKLEQVALLTVKEELAGKPAKKSKALLESFVGTIVKEADGDPKPEAVKEPSKLAGAIEYGKEKLAQGVGAVKSGASAVADTAKAAGRDVKDWSTAKKIGAAAGTAVAGYLIYRKLRAAGKSKEEAAKAAAASESDPDKKRMWMDKAQEWQGR